MNYSKKVGGKSEEKKTRRDEPPILAFHDVSNACVRLGQRPAKTPGPLAFVGTTNSLCAQIVDLDPVCCPCVSPPAVTLCVHDSG